MEITAKNATKTYINYSRQFCPEGIDPFDTVTWKLFSASIKDDSGKVIFTQGNVEFPDFYTQNCIDIVASKYFYGPLDKREKSLKQLLTRVCTSIAKWVYLQSYFGPHPYTNIAKSWKLDSSLDERAPSDLEVKYLPAWNSYWAYRDDLIYLCLHRFGAFNSPVQFNVGTQNYGESTKDNWGLDFNSLDLLNSEIKDDKYPKFFEYSVYFPKVDTYDRPQCSACFILSLQDNLDSIYDLAKVEGMLFKFGSGSGSSLDKLRSKKDVLSTGGRPSGPISFLKLFDRGASIIKSGGRSRRAAKLNCLSMHHPDIKDFISCKRDEERRGHALKKMGYARNMDEMSDQIAFQNVNISVRPDDKYFDALENHLDYELISPKTNKVLDKVKARELWDLLCECTWESADPGIQYDSEINRMNPVKAVAKQEATNPCLSGDTYVDTNEGKIRIDELARRHSQGDPLPCAFCWDTNNHRASIRPILRAWRTRSNAETIVITTDRGLTLRCTPNHEILIREHGRSSREWWVEAKDLRIGQVLRVWPRGTIRGRPVINDKFGTYYENRLVYSSLVGEIPEGYDIHHKDHNIWNNSLNNIELIYRKDHLVYHATGVNNPMYGRCRKGEVKRNKVIRSLNLACKYNCSTEGDYKNARRVQDKPSRYNLVSKLISLYGSWDTFIEEALHPNHKVVSITQADNCDVYDLEVEEFHNFVVSNSPQVGKRDGVVVHNCSEFSFIPDSACNLASLNLLKFCDKKGTFNPTKFRKACFTFLLGMEAIVDFASYPTQNVAINSHLFRPLGLGYGNLGALLMTKGLAYDSTEGRNIAGCVTSIMHDECHRASSRFAQATSPFYYWDRCKNDFIDILKIHRSNANNLRWENEFSHENQWNSCINETKNYGLRNAQVTLLAPTGTISFLMNLATLGVEPAIGLISYKNLAGGGRIKLVNEVVPSALDNLGYDEPTSKKILSYIEENDTIEGCKYLKEEHLSIFDCAFSPTLPDGSLGRSISPEGHVDMVAACQQFLSGAISKTINMPASSTKGDISRIYLRGRDKKCKALAIYRDGCKAVQVLETTDSTKASATKSTKATELAPPTRRLVPPTSTAIRHKFEIEGHKIYIHVTLFSDNTPAEIFIKAAKVGSVLNGLLEGLGISLSLLFQHNVPFETMYNLYRGMSFSPSGWVKPQEGDTSKAPKAAKSILDYIFRWIALNIFKVEDNYTFGTKNYDESSSKPSTEEISNSKGSKKRKILRNGDTCSNCGSGNLTPSGKCSTCLDCGTSGGCAG